MPPAEHVHWMFATGFLLLALFLLAEVIVGEEVWRRRTWRPYNRCDERSRHRHSIRPSL